MEKNQILAQISSLNQYAWSLIMQGNQEQALAEVAQEMNILQEKIKEMEQKPLTLKQVSGNLLGSNTYYTED